MLHLSIRTEDAYCHWISAFLCWAKWKTPETLTPDDVTRYLSHLATDRKVSASTQSQAFNALLFLFRRVLDKDMGQIDATRASKSPHVPQHLSRDEIKAVIDNLSAEFRLLAKLGYGTGLRLMELLRLRIKDVDFGNGVIVVRCGKGMKDRVVPMPKTLVAALKEQVAAARRVHSDDLAAGYGSVWMPEALAHKYDAKDWRWQYVFPSRKLCTDPKNGAIQRHHLFPTGFQQALALAGKKAGITKRVHPHALRHSFAAHCLETGHSLQQVQQLLGHKDVRTTMIYLHCLDNSKARSPLDSL